ncbi:endonuclease/exonuclease/phosphatase [Aphanothece hegewaldii CCALA 016]|uniref:Endonuclease/exonuclease/phosphatase n=1 Tax=Aphanothece hegewaldii CCALA 016 TaxID=2107694 RepID=A0A2T1LRP5_9CHRO|nr:esterase-like activity of phytase family protein [Aphanothece hegewaldii]PSF31326.1 endonuclease/exonuclease/phosphatase [Aphanothece hegewaldii CCALA 016]
MSDRLLPTKLKYLTQIFLSIILIFSLTACDLPRPVKAEDRMFLNISLDYLGEYQLPKQIYQNTEVGGLSGITYDRKTGKYYVISDDRSQKGDARFYTLDISLNSEQTKINQVKIENVTSLKDNLGKSYLDGTIDPEGISISPQNTLFISSEGNIEQGISPSIGEYNLQTGQILQPLQIPKRFLPNKSKDTPPQGIRNNLGFESLTLGISSTLKDDPYRLFTATENALIQDNPTGTPEKAGRIRLLHYVINPIGEPVLVAEHLYLLEPLPENARYHGLCELLAFEKEGYLLSLERTLGLTGFEVKIFQLITGDATDTSRIESLQGNIEKIQPMRKKLLLDLSNLGIELDNVEGMTFGPRLNDGSLSLMVVSDDNFRDDQITQFLLFRIKGI